MKSLNVLFILIILFVELKTKDSIESCNDNKNLELCDSFSDEDGYCCKLMSENSPAQIQRCQYYNKNEDIFNGFYLSTIKYNVDCQQYKQKIISNFYIHEHYQCGSLSPSTFQDCGNSNTFYKSNENFNCCLIKLENSDKQFCVKTSFPNGITSNYTLNENNRNYIYQCHAIFFKLSLITVVILIFIMI